jgi:hypothetical protein
MTAEEFTAALKDYHESALREALRRMLDDCPPVPNEVLDRMRRTLNALEPGVTVSQQDVKDILADRDHYRTLCLALANDEPGFAAAYRAGVAAGIKEGKRRCVAALAALDPEVDMGGDLNAGLAEDALAAVSVEP